MELATLLGVRYAVIHQWMKKGYVQPGERLENGFYYWTAAQVRAIQAWYVTDQAGAAARAPAPSEIGPLDPRYGLLSSAELARRCQVTVSTISSWVVAGTIPAPTRHFRANYWTPAQWEEIERWRRQSLSGARAAAQAVPSTVSDGVPVRLVSSVVVAAQLGVNADRLRSTATQLGMTSRLRRSVRFFTEDEIARIAAFLRARDQKERAA